MADTFLAQAGADKLMLLSGAVTTTVKTSEVVAVVDSFCADISPTPGGDTLWCGAGGDKVYLQSGQFTSTVKDSHDMSATETAFYACTYDQNGGDEVSIHAGAGQRKFFMRSGMTTSTLKTSLAASAFQFLGLSSNGTDTSVTDNDAGERRVVLVSGQFTTTVKDSETGPQTVTGPQYWGTGYTGDGNMLGSHRSPSSKIFIHSGQVTSTIKVSIAWADTHPAGLETSDVNGRLGLGGGGAGGMFGLILDNDFV